MSADTSRIRGKDFVLADHIAKHFGVATLEHKGASSPVAWHGLTAPVKPTLHLRHYIDESKAAVEVPAALAPQPLPAGFQWGMLANDRIGDCVIAMMLHSIEMFFLSVGQTPPPFSAEDAVAIYSAITGYNPSDPSTDQGTDEGRALAFWQDNGLTCKADGSVHKIVAAVAVDPADRHMRHLAMYEFDAVQYAIQLPLTWQGKQAWTGVPSDSNPDSQPGSWGGHGVAGRAYDASGVEDILTWGTDLPADGDSLDAYLVQASIVLTQEMVDSKTGFSRCGISFGDLMRDVKALPPNPVQ